MMHAIMHGVTSKSRLLNPKQRLFESTLDYAGRIASVVRVKVFQGKPPPFTPQRAVVDYE